MESFDLLRGGFCEGKAKLGCFAVNMSPGLGSPRTLGLWSLRCQAGAIDVGEPGESLKADICGVGNRNGSCGDAPSSSKSPRKEVGNRAAGGRTVDGDETSPARAFSVKNISASFAASS